MSTSTRRTPAFIPPAEYQSASPYRPPYTPPSIDREPSPARPVPENLHQFDSDTFNVDPDAPFLASAGTVSRSPPHSPSHRKFVGGLVSNLKKAIPHGRRRSQSVEGQDTIIEDGPRDSGYGSTSRLPAPPMTSHPEMNTPSSASITLQGHPTYEGKRLPENETIPASQNILNSPGSIQSPQYVDPEYGSDYARMSPPSSNASFRAYMNRVQKFFRNINELPWVATERVTVDYYPGRVKRSNRISRVVSLQNDQSTYSPDAVRQMDYTTTLSSPSTDLRDPELGEFEPYPSMHDVQRGVDGYPRYPNGYVPYPEQNYGMQYGQPIHMVQPTSTFPASQPQVVFVTASQHQYPYSSLQAS